MAKNHLSLAGMEIKKGFMIRVKVKSDTIDCVRYFSKANTLKAFLRYLKRNVKGGRVTFRHYRLN